MSIPVGQLGISHPLIVDANQEQMIYDPNARVGQEFAAPTTFDQSGLTGAGRQRGRGGIGSGMMGLSRGKGKDADDDDDDYAGMRGGARAIRRPNAGGAGNELSQLNQGAIDDLDNSKKLQPIELERTTFMLQFAWVPVLTEDRGDPPATTAAVNTP